MTIYEFLIESPPKKKDKKKDKKKEITSVNNEPAKEPPPPPPVKYSTVLKAQDLNNFNFSDKYQEISNTHKLQRDEVDVLKNYSVGLSKLGNQLTHIQKYTFKKLFENFIQEKFSNNLSYALCLLLFEESKFDKKYSGVNTINPTTKAMGIIQWIRSRFANFVLFLREKTHNFQNLDANTLKNMEYFLKITDENAKNDKKNTYSVADDVIKAAAAVKAAKEVNNDEAAKKAEIISDEKIEKFNEILWNQKEMIDYQIEFLMSEFNSAFYKARFKGLDEEAKSEKNKSIDIYSESEIVDPKDPDKKNKEKSIDAKTSDDLLNALTKVEKEFLNIVMEKFITPNNPNKKPWDEFSNHRIKKAFELLYNNITRKLDKYDLSDQAFKVSKYKYKDAQGKEVEADKTEFNDKYSQIQNIIKDIEKKIEKSFKDYPFLDEIHEIKQSETLATVVKDKKITWKSLVRYNFPFFKSYFEDPDNTEKDIYNFAAKFYGKIKTKILIPKYNCIIINSKEQLEKAASADGKTLEELIAFNASETKETDELDTNQKKKKKPTHVLDKECQNTQIVFLEDKNKKLSENLIKTYIRNILLEEKSNINKPYNQGNIKDMLLDKEGWTTDPHDRQLIKKWYIKMGLSHN